MDWLIKMISVAESLENPHTWSKFGDVLRVEETDNKKESVIKSPTFTVYKKPTKNRVFSIGVAFWLAVILVGGSYVLIEGVPYEKVVGDIVSIIDEEMREGEYTEEIQPAFTLVENEDMGFEIQIPTRMEISKENTPTQVSFIDPIISGDTKNRMILVEKSQTLSETQFETYVDQLSSYYSDQNFLFIEESDTELNYLPAKKYTYEFNDGSIRMRAVHIVLEEGDTTYKLMMYDNTEDFPVALSEFEISRESFFAW